MAQRIESRLDNIASGLNVRKRRMLPILVGLFFLLGCYTAPGKFKEEDSTWEEKLVNAGYREVYRRVIKGFRSCDMGVAQCYPFPELKEVHCDVFAPAVFGGPSPYVVGFVILKATDDNRTTVRLGTNKTLLGMKTRFRKVWMGFTEDHFCD